MNCLKKIFPLRESFFSRSTDQIIHLLTQQNKKRDFHVQLDIFLKNLESKEIPCFYMVGTPNHDNIGDSAIALASRHFIRKNFSNPYFEITNQQYVDNLEFLVNSIRKNDIIILAGGGNMGNKYLQEENVRRSVILNFPYNKIVSFPQTIYFTNDQKGEHEFCLSKAIYNKHNKLVLFARDNTSFQIMKQNFKVETHMAPDIVLNLDKINDAVNRKGVLCCLREDSESILSSDTCQKIKQFLSNRWDNVILTNMRNDFPLDINNRALIIEYKLQQFRTSELVITDCLHGIIFAVITHTPCIAINNNYHKISAFCSTWLSDVTFVRNIDNVSELGKKISLLQTDQYNKSITFNFDNLVKVLHGLL
jgi:pyruvyl transferase EpsI